MVHACCLQDPEDSEGYSGTGITDGGKLSCEWWELSSHPLEEQPTFNHWATALSPAFHTDLLILDGLRALLVLLVLLSDSENAVPGLTSRGECVRIGSSSVFCRFTESCVCVGSASCVLKSHLCCSLFFLKNLFLFNFVHICRFMWVYTYECSCL